MTKFTLSFHPADPAVKASCELLYRLGVCAAYKGFMYTAYAVSLCVQQQERLLLVTKMIYPDVARRYGTNWKAVERNIRTVSDTAWRRNRTLLEALAKRPLDRRPRCSDFLALLALAVISGPPLDP